MQCRQLTLSAPQLQPDLHQIAPQLTSNSHTVYSPLTFPRPHLRSDRDLIPTSDTISPAAAERVWKTGEKNVVH